MQTIRGNVAVITGAAGGIGRALALDMARRGAAGMALVDASDRVVQVAREINIESQRKNCREQSSSSGRLRLSVTSDKSPTHPPKLVWKELLPL